MLPVLFKCSFFTVYTYGFFVAIAFLVSAGLLTQHAKRMRLDEASVYNLCVLLLLSGIISARLFYVFLNWGYFKSDFFEIFKLQHGGLVWFGGLIGASLVASVYLKQKKMDLFATLDLFAPYAALAQAIGRIGCFFNGCCYGHPADWGIFFPVHGRILMPIQLFDAASLVVIFVVLRLVQDKARTGYVFAGYLLLASLQRFLLEFARGDERPFYYGLSIFQWVSILVFLSGLFICLFVSWKKKTV